MVAAAAMSTAEGYRAHLYSTVAAVHALTMRDFLHSFHCGVDWGKPAFTQADVQAVDALPGVYRAGVVGFVAPGVLGVSQGVIQAAQPRLNSGRWFNASDFMPKAPVVAVVGAAVTAHYPLGAKFPLAGGSAHVVGVLRAGDLYFDANRGAHFPNVGVLGGTADAVLVSTPRGSSLPSFYGGASLVVFLAGEARPHIVAREIQAAVPACEQTSPLFGSVPASSLSADIRSYVLGISGSVHDAMILGVGSAGLGVFGFLALALLLMDARGRDWAIRLVLGAGRASVAGAFVIELGAPVVAGVWVGWALATVIAHVVGNLSGSAPGFGTLVLLNAAAVAVCGSVGAVLYCRLSASSPYCLLRGAGGR